MHAGATLAGFAPIVDPQCRVLVLGSFPGSASLAAGHYYAHPRNQFWPIASASLGLELGCAPFEERYRLLRACGIGLWDVIGRCERAGSLDSNIRHAQPVRLPALLKALPRLRRLLLNGRRAQGGVRRVLRSHALEAGNDLAELELIDLPSTSPAFAAMSFDEKLACWRPALGGQMPVAGRP